MPKININGQVLYADLTPAENVRVKIIELDLGPNGVHDTILNKITGANGRFAGLSSNWQDREGFIQPPFGPRIDLPDIFNVTFQIESIGQIHKGPFVIVGNSSLPIVLPLNFKKPVEKANRELVQIIHLVGADYVGFKRTLYEFIESGSAGLVDTFLGNDYKAIHRILGANATLANLKQKLTQAGTSATTKAVDLVFCTHGNTDKVVFADGKKIMQVVLDALDDIPANIRSKFRMVFSTACFGDTHSDMWLDAGFACVSGSEGVYADSEVSAAPFLLAWEHNKTFNEAISLANAADVGNVADNLAIAYYNSIGETAGALEINSNRIVSGNGGLRIYSSPR